MGAGAAEEKLVREGLSCSVIATGATGAGAAVGLADACGVGGVHVRFLGGFFFLAGGEGGRRKEEVGRERADRNRRYMQPDVSILGLSSSLARVVVESSSERP